MKKWLFQSSVVLLLLGLMSTGHATPNQYVPAYCDAGHSLQKAIDRATEGAAIDVWGTCNESVVIRTDGLRIGAFNGQTAFINPPAGSPAFTIFSADNASISGLNINITGEASGIDVRGGSSAIIASNNFSGGARGVEIAQGSSAHILGNVILDSSSVGIFISGSSYGQVRDNHLHSTSGNFSQIFVTGSSAADVFNNTITASSGGGIDAVFASSVEAGSNNVSGTTGGAGLSVEQNAHMFLRSENTVNNPGGPAIFCGATGSLRLDVEQDLVGSVILNPGCEITNLSGVPFPPP